jgi:hypothetical protein
MFASPEAAERLAATCQADRTCARLACFQARVDARTVVAGTVDISTGARRISRHVDACAGHIAEAVQDLKAWAGDRAVVGGWLKVLAIDPYAAAHGAAGGSGPADLSLAFYVVPVGERA